MILHTLSATPSCASFTDCLNTCSADDTILLLGDGVYGALTGSTAYNSLKKSPAIVLVLDSDARGRGVIPQGFKLIDMDGFVALTESYPRQLAWF